MISQYLTVSGAYGRDYQSGTAAIADWKAGKDFVVRTFGPHYGQYISVRDSLPEGTRVNIRYRGDQRIVAVPQ